jgi:hypothetical protein
MRPWRAFSRNSGSNFVSFVYFVRIGPTKRIKVSILLHFCGNQLAKSLENGQPQKGKVRRNDAFLDLDEFAGLLGERGEWQFNPTWELRKPQNHVIPLQIFRRALSQATA